MDATQVSQAVNDKYSSIAQAASKSSKPSCCKPWSASSSESQGREQSQKNATSTNGTCCKPSTTSGSCCTPSTTNGTCCKPSTTSPPQASGDSDTHETHTNGESTDYASRVAASFGYHPSQLASLPPNTNLGLSCGNPLALTNVLPHETIIDLGSGGGLDCLLAAKSMVNNSTSTSTPLTGRVIGIDSSETMIALAQRNVKAAKLPSRDTTASDTSNDESKPDSLELVSFIHSEITNIPLPSFTASLVISNCVLNLLPQPRKPVVFHEIYRLLAPAGRVAISDILTLPNKSMPDDIRNNIALHVGCVAGAASVQEYKTWMVEAGFEESKIVFKANGSDLNAYKLTAEERKAQMQNGNGDGCCGGGGGCGANIRDDGQLFDEEVRDVDFNEYVASYEIYAVK